MFQLYNALNYLFQLREEMFTENLKFKIMKWWCSQYFFWIRHVSTRYSVCTSSFRKGFFPPANKVAGRYCFHRCLSLHREEGGVGTLHASRDRSHGRVSPSPHIRPEYLTPPPPTSDLGTCLPQTSDLGTCPATDIWWWSQETCSNLLIWGPSPTGTDI